MKIISLQAENVKRLTAVSITPDGNLVQITGKNGNGKTSVLDAIWWAIEGTKNIQAAPIRKGAKEAVIRLDLGELKVKRTFKEKEGGGYTTSITVENADGARYGSPQAMLDALVGELTFDPLAFTRMDAKKQFDALRRFVPGVDFDRIDSLNKGDFARRTDINRDAKAKKAQADGIAILADAPAEPIDESALTSELQAAAETNAQVERDRAKAGNLRAAVADDIAKATDFRTNAARLRAQADEADKAAEARDAQAKQFERDLAAVVVGEPVSTSEIAQRMETARAANAKFADAKAKRETKTKLLAEVADLEAQSAALTKTMADRHDAKEKAIAEATMPIDGLGFGDGCVMLNGVPFDQGSDAEQLRASIAIAAAMNPKLRVVRVRDGSLLDQDALALLAEFADRNDMQIWVERVDSTGKIGFVIEDGHNKVADADPVSAAA